MLEDSGQRPLQFLFDYGLDAVEGHRRYTILQLAQLFNVFPWEDVAARAHQLAQLDKAGTQLFQDAANPDRIGPGGFGNPVWRSAPAPQPLGHFAQTMFDQDAGDGAEVTDAAHSAADKGNLHRGILIPQA